MDNAYIELHAGGKIHQKVSVTVNLNGNYSAFSGPTVLTPPAAMPGTTTLSGSGVAIEDVIVSFDFCDPFHLWVGHLLVPVDRSNASGPFFMIPWNYPGFLGVGSALVVAAPHEGPSGRNNGAVLWGEFNEGQVKYLVGAFDNSDVTTSPLYSGRLNLAIIGKEPGFWGNASYFGDKDVLALGVGGQFQSHGSATATDDKAYTEVNADLLGEFKLGGGAWVTGEAAYYHFGVADTSVKDSFYVLAALASPHHGRRQHPADGALPVGQRAGHRQGLEHRRRAQLPGQGAGAARDRDLLARQAAGAGRRLPDRELDPARRPGDLLLKILSPKDGAPPSSGGEGGAPSILVAPSTAAARIGLHRGALRRKIAAEGPIGRAWSVSD